MRKVAARTLQSLQLYLQSFYHTASFSMPSTLVLAHLLLREACHLGIPALTPPKNQELPAFDR